MNDKRPRSMTPEQLKAIREKITERLEKIRERESKLPAFTPPVYDQEFFDAMDWLEEHR